MTGWIKMPLGMEVGLRTGDCVGWGPRSPSSQRERSPQFSAHVYCSQTTGWINMKLGMQVGLGPGHTVLDGDPAPTPKGHSPQFLACICCGQMAAWIKMPLGMEVGLGPGDFVLDKDPAHPPEKGSEPPSEKGGRATLLNFRPIFIVVKRLDASRCHLVWSIWR